MILDEKVGGVECLEIYDDEGVPIFTRKFLFSNRMDERTTIILGRPIRLADVLLTIEEKISKNKYDDFHLCLNQGNTEMSYTKGTYDGEGDSTSYESWNLNYDLHLQTEECVAFIAGLLSE